LVDVYLFCDLISFDAASITLDFIPIGFSLLKVFFMCLMVIGVNPRIDLI